MTAFTVVMSLISLALAFASGYVLARESVMATYGRALRVLRNELANASDLIAEQRDKLAEANRLRRMDFAALCDLKAAATAAPVTAEQIELVLDALEEAANRPVKRIRT